MSTAVGTVICATLSSLSAASLRTPSVGRPNSPLRLTQGRRIVELERKVEGSEEEKWQGKDASKADDVQRVPVENVDAHAKRPRGLGH